jgi:hypothetical protein
VENEDRQNLVYHYGISHKLVFGLLKAHVDKTLFHLPKLEPQQVHRQQQQLNSQV